VVLRLAGSSADHRHGRALSEFAGGALRPDSWFPDVDQAVEAAEQQLLAAAATRACDVPAVVPMVRSSLMAGLDAAQCARLHGLLEAERRLAAGEWLFRQGDAGDRLYVLTEGSISVVSVDTRPAAAPGALRQRYLSLSPGMMLGETAMLDGGGRSANAIADRPSVVHALSLDALQTLLIEDPRLCAMVYRNIALHLSQRLRAAAGAWRASTS
jgi:CRP-like cAMP-binding protein